jgi:acyl-CoA thioester hydrolase
MARIKIDLPKTFSFSTTIPVRVTDLNYAGHVGNDSILSMIHEARVQFFNHFGYGELDFAGIGTIMSDVAIEYKNEVFYGDEIIVSVAFGDITKVAFDVLYKLEKRSTGQLITVAYAKTWIACYNFKTKKLSAIPEEAVQKITGR